MYYLKALKILRKLKKLKIEAIQVDYYITIEKNTDDDLYERYKEIEIEKDKLLSELWCLYNIFS